MLSRNCLPLLPHPLPPGVDADKGDVLPFDARPGGEVVVEDEVEVLLDAPLEPSVKLEGVEDRVEKAGDCKTRKEWRKGYKQLQDNNRIYN